MKLIFMTNRKLKAQDDGRLSHLSCIEGEFRAAFNIFPYRFVKITEQQFERYKKICKEVSPCFFTCAEHDNGLPKFINKLFYD